MRNYITMKQSIFKSAFIAVVLPFGVLNAAEEEISITSYLADPGFEARRESGRQLNAEGTASINGWRATPINANAWTSVGYVTTAGTTLGDNRDAILPPQGSTYLRMLTVNSSDWLALQSPQFELKPGVTYAISFKIATDAEAPMERMDICLRDKSGERHGSQSHAIASLKPGWNTIVYRARYDGPPRTGWLEITGRRNKALKTGSLNIDDFKTPDKTAVAGSK